MYFFRNFIYFSLLLYSTIIYSQTGPGGVGKTDGKSNLVLWLRPDAQNNNKTWKDFSGKNYHFTQGNGAKLAPNSINGYSSYHFDGVMDYFEKTSEKDFYPDQFSVFSTALTESSAKHKAIYSFRDEYFYNNTSWKDGRYGFVLYAQPNDNLWSFWTGEGTGNNSSWFQLKSQKPTAGQWSVQNINFTSIGKSLFIDGEGRSDKNKKIGKNTAKPFRIGAGKNDDPIPDYHFKGNIGEIIMFKVAVNDVERIIINNYLAAKYNISLSNTEKIYTQDLPQHGNFDHHVAGIGQKSNKNHSDSQGTGIVKINNPTSLKNDSFLFWGENQLIDVRKFQTETTNYYEQLSSSWRVSMAGNVGNVDVAFDLTKIDLSNRKENCSGPLQLVISNKADFSNPRYYPLTETNGYLKATKIQFSDGDHFSVRYADNIVWNGTTFLNGSGRNQEPTSNDSCRKLIIKSGQKARLTSNVYIRELEVEPGAELELSAAAQLTVENSIKNNGSIDFVEDAQLIQKHDGVNANSGNGKLRINQQGTSNKYNYNYWSSPVNRGGFWKVGFLEQNQMPLNFNANPDANSQTTPLTLSSRWLHTYNASETIGYYGWNRITTNTPLAPGLGYTMKGSGSNKSVETYEFSGTANSGDYSINGKAGYDLLVGNPYPSAMDAHEFINDNLEATDATIRFYEQFETNKSHNLKDYEGGYATINLMSSVAAMADANLGNGGNSTKGAPTKKIAVGQGFFISMENDAPIKFRNSQRVFARESINESIFYRVPEQHSDDRTKLWLHFTDPKQRTREIALGYDKNASEGFDKGYDAEDYSDYPDYMLWDIPNHQLVIQGLEKFNPTEQIPLKINITNPGTYTVSLGALSNFPDDTPIYLKDDFTNSYYNLKESDALLFLDPGNYNQRFSIVYKNETLETPKFEKNSALMIIYNKQEENIKIKSETWEIVRSVTFISTDGKEILQSKITSNNSVNVSQLSSGIYIVQLSIQSGITKNIRFIKY